MIERTSISAEDAEEYTAALGQSLGGGWRHTHLGVRMGVPQALGMTTDAWVRERLGGYMRLSIEERREAVAELAGEGLSQREIAAVVGVGSATVNRDLSDPNGTRSQKKNRQSAAVEAPSVSNGTPQTETDSTLDYPVGTVVDLRTLKAVPEDEIDRDPPQRAKQRVPDIRDAAFQIADDAGKAELAGLRIKNRLRDRLRPLSEVGSEFDANDTGEIIDEEFFHDNIERPLEAATAWAARVRAAMPTGLRIVQGGRS